MRNGYGGTKKRYFAITSLRPKCNIAELGLWVSPRACACPLVCLLAPSNKFRPEFTKAMGVRRAHVWCAYALRNGVL